MVAHRRPGLQVAGPGLVVITEFDGQIFTLDTSGTRTDLGEPLDEPYSASFAVSGFDGVVYAYQTSAPSVPEGTSPVFRRDADGWVELPAPPGETFGGGEVWATGPDAVWLSGAGLSLWDGVAWREYPGVYLGSSADWLPVGDDIALLVDQPKDVTMSGIGTRWAHRIEAWSLDHDGYTGRDRVVERWRLEGGFESSPPNYLADGTTIVQFVDGLHVWEPR